MTAKPLDLLVSIDRESPRTLGRQIEDQLRQAIREGTLRPGTRLPSTRDLARELGVSRPIVVDAYAQLAGEGYLELRPGTRPRVTGHGGPARRPAIRRPEPAPPPQYDFRPGLPDLATFPRAAWLRSLREALASMREADFGYTDPHGTEALRLGLGDYLGRVRGVVSDAERVVITSGWVQGRTLLCHALVALGARRIAIEDPCHDEVRVSAASAGLELVPVPVDGEGLRVDRLERTAVDAVLVTPAHQYPTGSVMSGARRGALLEWLRRQGTIAIEDDYDAEFRYDRAPVGALQGMDPQRIVYAGTASKTLAPAMRLGWLVLPPRLLQAVRQQQRLADFGVSRIEQHAFADFLARGELDRHLRRMRAHYRARRDALVEALTDALPEVRVHGIRAGLHVSIQLRDGDRGRAIRDEAARRGVGLTALSDYYLDRTADSAMLLLGYARCSEPGIRAGVRELAAAVRTTRRPEVLGASVAPVPSGYLPHRVRRVT
ncbi:MAG TPA: PLP-dependent aminotransferase family protein [Gemmatimonadales bacterium]|nr:PLP-dependent aminotransferase family protein [Gemmatimonadales bacterium]